MNLLPFVMIIIVILSLFSLSQFGNHKIKNTETKLYRAYFTSLRKARLDKEKAAYDEIKRKIPNKPNTKKNPQGSPKKQKDKHYFREKRIGWNLGKLNLSSLLTDATKWPNLEKIAASYIHELYSHAVFYPKNKDPASALIKAIIKELKDSDNPPCFHEITFKDPFLQDIFYKMIRGTNTYDLNKKGYPPFGDFFSFEKIATAPMHFHYANTAFLTILLGKDKCNTFIKLEKEELKDDKVKSKCKSPYLEHQDLKKVFETIEIVNPDPILDLFDMHYTSIKSPPGVHQDKETQITVRVQ